MPHGRGSITTKPSRNMAKPRTFRKPKRSAKTIHAAQNTLTALKGGRSGLPQAGKDQFASKTIPKRGRASASRRSIGRR